MQGKIKGSKRLTYLVLVSTAIFFCIVLAAQFIMDGGTKPQAKPRAAIIDGLLHFPNPTFVGEATKILSDAGYEVDYIGSGNVTVDFYSRLPSLGYRFIVLRVHCGPLFRRLSDGTEITEGAALFTTEAYDPRKYIYYQKNKLLARASITGIPDEVYFAVPPWFFYRGAEGEFLNTTVVLDSCYGFYADAPLIMAQAFIRSGSKVFIGWNGEVQANHTDHAVLALLRALYMDGLTVEGAVARAMEEIGPDPFYRSIMLYYPLEMGDYRLNIITEND